MHISRLRIRNFRNFRKAEFQFQEGVNALIGENGSGKTNAFYALRLLLDDSLPRRAQNLRKSDFNRALGDWRGHWVIISLEFENLDSSEGCQVIRHRAGHMDAENRGTYTLINRPKAEVRRQLHALCKEGKSNEDIQKVLDEVSTDQYECVHTGRAEADFLDDDTYASIVGDVDALDFPDPDEVSNSDIGVTMLQTLHQEVSCTFVKALRDVVGDLKSFRDSPLLNLLRGASRNIEVEDSEPILEQVRKLNEDISELDEVKDVAKGVQDTLLDTVGHTYSPGIAVYSGLPEEIDRLFQRLTLRVSDSSAVAPQGDLSELSLGGANLIYLSLKLLEYELKTTDDRAAHFLLIEEPEAHIHTHIQKTLFENYNEQSTQVVVSTHSTHISAASQIRRVNILANDEDEAHCYHPAAGLDEDQINRVARYLDAVRSTLLFAKGVILVEGDAELILITALVKEVFGVSLDELGISLVNMSSAVFSNVALIFGEERIRRRCSIVTDLDTSVVKLPVNSKDKHTPTQKRCRDSQEAGERRRDALEEAYESNDWVDTFYAKHTFEVEYLKAGNADDIVRAMKKVYKRNTTKQKSEENLRDEDLGVSGIEVLKLARKQGKGWFALLLAEEASFTSSIPDYILEALVFACRDATDLSFLKRVAEHRLDGYAKGGHKVSSLRAKLRKKKLEEFANAYVGEFRDDPLSFMLNELEVTT